MGLGKFRDSWYTGDVQNRRDRDPAHKSETGSCMRGWLTDDHSVKAVGERCLLGSTVSF